MTCSKSICDYRMSSPRGMLPCCVSSGAAGRVAGCCLGSWCTGSGCGGGPGRGRPGCGVSLDLVCADGGRCRQGRRSAAKGEQEHGALEALVAGVGDMLSTDR